MDEDIDRFELETPGRRYQLKASSAAEAMHWIPAPGYEDDDVRVDDLSGIGWYVYCFSLGIDWAYCPAHKVERLVVASKPDGNRVDPGTIETLSCGHRVVGFGPKPEDHHLVGV